jgi:hypothetical protein
MSRAVFVRWCRRCSAPFMTSHWMAAYCSCRPSPAVSPAVYRFICPDGRSYVGSAADHHTRKQAGLSRLNGRISEALKRYPAESWTFELLELLPLDGSYHDRLAAEQRHIDRLRSWEPERGFNMVPAHEPSADLDGVEAWKQWTLATYGRPVTLPNGRSWNKHGDAVEHFGRMLARYRDEQIVEDRDDHSDLAAPLTYNDEKKIAAARKIGAGIAWFFRRRKRFTRGEFSTFWLHRIDGSENHFSLADVLT